MARDRGTMIELTTANLMQVEYGERECYAFARTAYRVLGIELPEDPAECLAREGEFGRVLQDGEACRLGDCVVIEQPGGLAHLGVALDAFRFVNVVKPGRPRVDRIAAWRKLGMVARIVRPRGLKEEGRP